MNQAFELARDPVENGVSPVTAQTLRRWCVPETILAATDLFDEELLLIHGIRQARRNGARILLVHVLDPRKPKPAVGQWYGLASLAVSPEFAQGKLNRMSERFRWSGIPCETMLLVGSPAKEILALAKSRAIDRILMVLDGASGNGPMSKTLAEDIFPHLGFPVCTISGSSVRSKVNDGSRGGIALGVSLHSDCTIPLAFACRLAQELRTSLKVMHVFGKDDYGIPPFGRSPMSVASRLPWPVLREAELFCPLEITIRQGDPASEILSYQDKTDQELIVLGPATSSAQHRPGSASVVHRIMREARCPVITLGQIRGSPEPYSAEFRMGPKPPQSSRP